MKFLKSFAYFYLRKSRKKWEQKGKDQIFQVEIIFLAFKNVLKVISDSKFRNAYASDLNNYDKIF